MFDSVSQKCSKPIAENDCVICWKGLSFREQISVHNDATKRGLSQELKDLIIIHLIITEKRFAGPKQSWETRQRCKM